MCSMNRKKGGWDVDTLKIVDEKKNTAIALSRLKTGSIDNHYMRQKNLSVSLLSRDKTVLKTID